MNYAFFLWLAGSILFCFVVFICLMGMYMRMTSDTVFSRIPFLPTIGMAVGIAVALLSLSAFLYYCQSEAEVKETLDQ